MRYYPDHPLSPCAGCDVVEGCLHKLGCDDEVCPRCLRQLIWMCSCWDDKGIFENEELEQEGRIPWLSIPPRCKLCGTEWQDDCTVSDEEWQAIVPPNLQKEILCKPCYERLKALWKVRGREGWQDKMVSSKAGNE